MEDIEVLEVKLNNFSKVLSKLVEQIQHSNSRKSTFKLKEMQRSYSTQEIQQLHLSKTTETKDRMENQQATVAKLQQERYQFITSINLDSTTTKFQKRITYPEIQPTTPDLEILVLENQESKSTSQDLQLEEEAEILDLQWKFSTICDDDMSGDEEVATTATTPSDLHSNVEDRDSKEVDVAAWSLLPLTNARNVSGKEISGAEVSVSGKGTGEDDRPDQSSGEDDVYSESGGAEVDASVKGNGKTDATTEITNAFPPDLRSDANEVNDTTIVTHTAVTRVEGSVHGSDTDIDAFGKRKVESQEALGTESSDFQQHRHEKGAGGEVLRVPPIFATPPKLLVAVFPWNRVKEVRTAKTTGMEETMDEDDPDAQMMYRSTADELRMVMMTTAALMSGGCETSKMLRKLTLGLGYSLLLGLNKFSEAHGMKEEGYSTN